MNEWMNEWIYESMNEWKSQSINEWVKCATASWSANYYKNDRHFWTWWMIDWMKHGECLTPGSIRSCRLNLELEASLEELSRGDFKSFGLGFDPWLSRLIGTGWLEPVDWDRLLKLQKRQSWTISTVLIFSKDRNKKEKEPDWRRWECVSSELLATDELTRADALWDP